MGCAAALAAIELFEKERLLEDLQPKIECLRSSLIPLESLPHVGNVRQCGLIAAIELVQDKAAKTPYPWEERVGVKVCIEARRHGLLLRPLGHIMIIMPPLIIKTHEIETVVEIVCKSIQVVTGQ